MTILIVEGCDLSGKTYAIERIAKHFNSGFILKNTLKPKSLKDTEKIYAQYWKILNLVVDYHNNNPDALVILDRFYPSQAIYSYLRERDDMKHPEIKALEQFCFGQNVKLLHLQTPVDELERRFDKRGDEHIRKIQLEKLHNRYVKFMKKTLLPVLHIDTAEEGWLEKVEEFIL